MMVHCALSMKKCKSSVAEASVPEAAAMEEQMGLDMKTRKKVCAAIFRRYQRAKKKDKGKMRYAVKNGKPVKFVAKQSL